MLSSIEIDYLNSVLQEEVRQPARFHLVDAAALPEPLEQWYVAMDDDGEAYITGTCPRPARYGAGPFTRYDDADEWLGRDFLDALDEALTPLGRTVVGYVGLAVMTLGLVWMFVAAVPVA